MWERLANECDDALDKDVAAMADAWHDGSAHRLVDSLTAQQAAREHRQQEQLRHEQREARRAQTSLAVAVLLLAAAVAGLVLAWGWRPGTAGNVAVLVMLPAVAAAAGALIRTSLDAGRQWTRAGVLGGAAGLIIGLLFVASQLFSALDVLHTGATEGIRRLLFFVVPIGFVAGLTFDGVYGELRGVEVSQVATLERLDKP